VTHFGIARVERSRGNLAEAETQIQAALGIIESLRSKVVTRDLRTSYFASNKNAYDFYIDLLMQMDSRQPSTGYAAKALVVSEHARARSMLESLGEVRANIRQGVAPELLNRERSLQQRVNARAERLTRLLSGKHTEEDVAGAKKELDAVLTEYQQAQAQVRESSPRYAALTQPQPLSAKEIQQQLDEDTLLLEYSLGKDQSFLWSVTPTSISSYVLPKQAEIELAARRVYELLTVRNLYPVGETLEQRTSRVDRAETEYPKAAKALSQMLIGPVAAQLGVKRLIIVSEGVLQYVPFGALPMPEQRRGEATIQRRTDATVERASDRHVIMSPRLPPVLVPLIVEHEIVTLPSASVLAVLRHELTGRPPAPRAVAVLADPVFRIDDSRVGDAARARRGGATKDLALVPWPPSALSESIDVERSAKESGVEFSRLRFSRQEAEAIASLMPLDKSLKAVDFAASRASAISPELSSYRILHFATHGLLNSQHPELSGIVLSLVDEQGRPQDGFLRLHEIYNLRLGADLVVLSACQTALGREIKGEGLVGLTRGFMYAGAPRVVASLWNVDDRATAELMKRFYTWLLKEHQSPAAALRAAQISMWREKRWQQPHFWAAFIAQGEWK
jgi:CHAT domain-containing protein